MKKLLSKRGMTLVEVIVASALLILVISVTGTIIITSMNVFGRTTSYNQAQILGDGVLDYLHNRLAYSSAVSLATNADSCSNCLRVENGVLQLSGDAGANFNSMLGEDSGFTISIETSANGATLNVKVIIKSAQDVYLFNRESSFLLVNIERDGRTIGGTSTLQTDPYIYFN